MNGAKQDGQDWHDLRIVGSVPMSWLAYAAEQGCLVDQVVERAGVVEEKQAAFVAGIALHKLLRLIEEIYADLLDEGMGVEVGWRMPPTAYGSLGYALLCSATVGDGLAVLQRFWHLLGRGIMLDLSIHPPYGRVHLFWQYPMAAPVHRLVVDSIVSSVYRGIMLLIPDAAAQIEVWLDYPRPADAERLLNKMPKVCFDMPLVQYRFPVDLLALPLPMASVSGHLAAIHQCDIEERTGYLQGQWTARVQKELGYAAAGFPTLEQTARRLGVTARTLRRRLCEEGSRYTALIDAVRLRDAVILLDNPAVEIHQIAEQLAYQDPANFTRAFRKWTGKTPSQYRQRSLASASHDSA